jgi:hypothetical protein
MHACIDGMVRNEQTFRDGGAQVLFSFLELVVTLKSHSLNNTSMFQMQGFPNKVEH